MSVEEMEREHQDRTPKKELDPWNSWENRAARSFRATRRIASPMRASIGSPTFGSPMSMRKEYGVPTNSWAGQMGSHQPSTFTPSSIDPTVYRLPYTLVTEKDVIIKKFAGGEDDHEPFLKWIKGIRRYIDNKIVNPQELEAITMAMEWAEEQGDLIGEDKKKKYFASNGVNGIRLDTQLKELLLAQTEGRANALVEKAFGGLDAWWRLKDRYLVRHTQKVSLMYQDFHSIKAVARISDIPAFLDDVDEKVMKIEEAEGGDYKFDDQHKLGKLKTCLPSDLLERIGHEIDDSTTYLQMKRKALERCRNHRTGIVQTTGNGVHLLEEPGAGGGQPEHDDQYGWMGNVDVQEWGPWAYESAIAALAKSKGKGKDKGGKGIK